MGAIAGYAFTRVVSTPLDNADIGNWSCMLGMAALYVEGLLVLISGFAMVTRSASRTALVEARDSSPANIPCLAVAHDSGYDFDEAEVIHWGQCPECLATTSESGGDGFQTRACDGKP